MSAWNDVTKLVTARFGNDEARTLAGYEKLGGYQVLRKALGMKPDDIAAEVKTSNLRGRGGAGFATGVKWGFVPKDAKAVHLVVNCDESEPGTCKDRELVFWDPHLLIEGMIISGYALRATHNYIYIRGEMMREYAVLAKAVEEAYGRGYLGKNVLGSGYECHITVHRGAGAYICGEETALLNSLEGKRGQPRLKPPFPAIKGLFDEPTIVNNVETIMNVPFIVDKGGPWFAALGPGRSGGTRIVCVSGHVNKPGNYEIELGTTMREVIYDLGGGVWGGELKAIIPGGASAPMLTGAHLDVACDFEAIAAAGSMAGSGAIVIINDKTCIVEVCLNLDQFFEEESCGKCTPCREGTRWLLDILTRIVRGNGRPEDIPLLNSVCGNLKGKSFCPLGDSATSCILSAFKYFPEEFEYICRHGVSMLKRELAGK